MPLAQDSVKIRHPKKRAMLAAIAGSANIVKAAKIAQIDRDTHYEWLRKDPDYAHATAVAWERAADALEAEAARRAFEGTIKPIYHGGKRATDIETDEEGRVVRDKNGKPIGIPASVREYSDTLLIFLLKGRRPHVYRENISIDSRFVNKDGTDRPFMLADADALIAAADAEEETAGARLA